MIKKILKFNQSPDYFLLSLILILTIFGLIILASASSSIAQIKFGDSFYYLKRQITYGLLPGILCFIFAYFFPYKYYKKIIFGLLLFNIFLLILVKFSPWGVNFGGSSRWLKVGPIIFQPSEFLKITYIIYIAAWLSNVKNNRITDFQNGFIPFLIISGTIGFLLYIQPATSIIIILLLSGSILYFISGAKLKYFVLLFFLGIIGFSILFLFDSGYRFARIKNFINPSDVYGGAYQSTQALITIGSGGLTGFGFGKSTTKARTLPEPLGDSIFAVASQELGFIGAGSLVLLLAFLVIRLFVLALKSKDRFGQLILCGFALIFGLQSIIHIAVLIKLFPITGIPLPFVSYGGTFLTVVLFMSGTALNISKKII
ncbi:MAG: FtsW/RodA/SpoVE family cell cycle protein [Patescibacteria group bacterium]|nr:FtsW/RodA/SpoVE family cell cycle protein [Patescibacteria group bacterium]